MHIRITLEFFKKDKCQGIVFFSKAPDVILMRSHIKKKKKKTELYDDLLLLSKLF